jgi:hypothetical protein
MRTLAVVAFGLLLACDEKKPAPAPAPSASAAEPVVTASAPPPSPPPSASAAPSASTSMITGDAKDVVLTVKDPNAEPDKTIKAATGGSVTLFLPDYQGTVWSVDTADKTLGKAKEEVIPGFAPQTNGHQFKWTTSGPLLKAGQKHTVKFVNKKIGDKAAKPSGSFSLTIELI